jgi:recombination protein RecR
MLSEFPVRITRLARGITAGSVLEYANREVLADALIGRQQL